VEEETEEQRGSYTHRVLRFLIPVSLASRCFMGVLFSVYTNSWS
jgi:hypothetical protein